MEEALRAAGLAGNDIRVYKALLKLGTANVSMIMGACGLHRKTVYDTLDRLASLGLAGWHREGKKRMFTAANPSKLLDLAREKENMIKDALPGLLKIADSAGEKTDVVVFKGKQGLTNIFEDIIKSGAKTWLSLISSGKGKELLPEYVSNFHRRRVEAGVRYKVIYHKGGGEVQRRVKEHKGMKLTEVRILPHESTIPISIWIYGDKTAFMIWGAETGIMIEDKKLTRAFKDHFEVLWQVAKEV